MEPTLSVSHERQPPHTHGCTVRCRTLLYVSLDFGGPLFEMDVRAFKPGVAGEGTKKLSEALWLYTEDGSYPGDS